MTYKNNMFYIKSNPFFNQLEDHIFERIISGAQVKTYQKDEAVFCEGDQATLFYYVLSGYLKLCNKTLGGSESIKKLAKPGDFFGEVSLMEGATYLYDCEATNTGQILCMDAVMLRREMQTNPILASTIIHELIKSQRTLEAQVEYLAIMNTSQRIGWFLLNNSRQEEPTRKFNLKHEKSIIACFLGMKPETFSRSIKKLNKLDVFIRGTEVSINNVELLKRYCLDETVIDSKHN